MWGKVRGFGGGTFKESAGRTLEVVLQVDSKTVLHC